MRTRRHSLPWLLLLLAATTGLTTLPVDAQDDPASQTDALVEELRQRQQEIQGHEAELEAAEGEDRLVLQRLITQKRLEQLEGVGELVEQVLELEQGEQDATGHRELATDLLQRLPDYLRERISEIEERIDRARADAADATPEDQAEAERRIADSSDELDLLYEALLSNTTWMEALGLDATTERENLAEQLGTRAETLAVRIGLAIERRDEARTAAQEASGDAALQTALREAEERLTAETTHLEVAVRLMGELDLDTTAYREQLIQAKGELTPDILDSEVALSLFRRWMQGLGGWIRSQGPPLLFRVLLALLVLAAFRILSRLVGRLIKRAVSGPKSRLSQLMQDTIVSWGSKAVMALGLLVALSQLGLNVGPVLAGLGIAGFVIGFALQDTLANFAAGMMILGYRPYDVGDLIEAAGVSGKVSKMSLVSTTILTLDHQTLIVPNGKIWGDVIRNVTDQKIRRVDMTFGISYGDDIPHAERVLNSILAEHDKVLDDPEPMVKLHNLGESSVDFVVRPWVATDDYWDVYWDVTRAVKMRFDAEGISIPFPQRDVHLIKDGSTENP
jgi:small conductance mechanosensitive channel